MLKYIYYAIFRPVERQRKIMPIRCFLLWPIVFDFFSLLAQLIYWRRASRILDRYAVDDSHHRLVQDYNAGVTLKKKIIRTRRAEKFYAIATAMPLRDVSKEKILIVGPRNVHELLLAWLHGFSWANIEAIDLYSAHPKIKVQSMDETDYPEKTFDVIIMANTFSYTADPNRTVSEMARILKPNGHFIFNATYDPKNPDCPADRIPVKEVMGILKAAGLRLVYHMAFNKINSAGRPQTSHTLGVARSDSESHLLEPLENQLD